MTLSFRNALSRGMILAANGWLLASCSAAELAPTGPSAATTPRQVSLAQQAGATDHGKASRDTLTFVRALGRVNPLRRSVTATAQIGPEGGALMLPSVGLSVVVPRGAVDSVTTFSVTALPGNAIAYEFAPHGITFAVPVQLHQSLTRSTWHPGTQLRGGYFKSSGQVNSMKRQAQVDELLPATQSGAEAVLQLKHFSGYLIAMG